MEIITVPSILITQFNSLREIVTLRLNKKKMSIDYKL